MDNAEQIPIRTLEALLVNLLDLEGELHHSLVGESMQPTLPAGSLLKVKPLTNEPIIGDLLVFVWADQLVAHRLIHVKIAANNQRRMITQGDNCIFPDPVLTPDRIIGQVCSATYRGRMVWPLGNQSLWRWRWIVRYYLLAVRRHLRV